MKAVIMAGGEGTRLKAVTGATPKPMTPLLGRPMLEHILLLLKREGFTDICMTLKYRPEDIMDYFADGRDWGVRVQYRVEREARGTAGGVKACADFYGGEDFLVISGDAACDMPLAALMARHRAADAAATLALCRRSEPTSFGLAVTDAQGRIHSFIEKPQWPRVVTDLVNTGIYVLSPRAMDYVPEGAPYDFARELFPLLLRRGETLIGHDAGGYWCDVGTPLSYYRCCVDALEGRLRLNMGEAFRPRAGERPPAQAQEACTRSLICPCNDRAALMGTLSEFMLDLGADYSDGLRLYGAGYALHISPLEERAAVRVAVASPDAEFAESLALSAKELIDALAL